MLLVIGRVHSSAIVQQSATGTGFENRTVDTVSNIAKPTKPTWGGGPGRVSLMWLWCGAYTEVRSVPRVYTERNGPLATLNLCVMRMRRYNLGEGDLASTSIQFHYGIFPVFSILPENRIPTLRFGISRHSRISNTDIKSTGIVAISFSVIPDNRVRCTYRFTLVRPFRPCYDT